MCTAIGLQKAGWQVSVVERWPTIVGIGAGLGVWPDAQAALDSLGLGGAFLERSIAFGASSLFNAGGRRLCAVPSARAERIGGRPIRILRRSDLIELLAEHASECEIRTGVDIAEHPELADRADLIVGADGLGSSVRSALMPASRTTPRYSGFVAWRGSVDRELDDASYGETWGDGSLFGLTRLRAGETNWYAAVPEADPAAGTFAAVAQRFAGWRDPIPEVLAATDTERVLRHAVFDLAPDLDSYVHGTVALVGDAAHAMTPNLGRGACEAILDAVELVAQVGATDDIATALAAYDRIRRPPTQKAVHASRRAMTVATTRYEKPRDLAARALSVVVR